MYDKCYLISRVYNKKEIKRDHKTNHIYGWTYSKNMVKAFLQQRDSKKYFVEKAEKDMIAKRLNLYHDEMEGYMLNYVKLKSVKNDEEVKFFITANEMEECEKKIQKLFGDACSLDSINSGEDILRYVLLVLNLDKNYYETLYYLGYRPKEIDQLFDSYYGDGVYERSEYSYEGMSCEEFYCNHSIESMSSIQNTEDIAKKIIYSLESFIKVLKEDL